MNNILLFALLLLGSGAQALGPGLPGTADCITAANQQFLDFANGTDPDGAPIYLDSNGGTVVAKPAQVKRTLENGVETLTYTTKIPKMGIGMARPQDTETVTRTVAITRDGSGRLTGISKKFDGEEQRGLPQAGSTNIPKYRSFDNKFSYDGDRCSVEQTIIVQTEGDSAKETKNVIYDKAFCDKIEPMVREFGGPGKADQCAAFIGQTQAAYDARNSELGKEGKVLKAYSSFGSNPLGSRDSRSNFSLILAMGACSIGRGQGMGGMLGGFRNGTDRVAPPAGFAPAPGDVIRAPPTDGPRRPSPTGEGFIKQ